MTLAFVAMAYAMHLLEVTFKKSVLQIYVMTPSGPQSAPSKPLWSCDPLHQTGKTAQISPGKLQITHEHIYL